MFVLRWLWGWQDIKIQLKRQLAQTRISRQSWQQEASDWDSWCSSARKASHKFKAERQEAAKERRRRQNERAASQSSSVQTFTCPKCSRACPSRIRLYSHRWVCKSRLSTFPKSSSASNLQSVAYFLPCIGSLCTYNNIQFLVGSGDISKMLIEVFNGTILLKTFVQ